MQCRRTANAGVLLTLDGVSVLLDGVCRQSGSYYGTPEEERERLLGCMPDVVAFTHGHFDHFDRSFAQQYQKLTLRSILGPEGLLKDGLCTQAVKVGSVSVTPIISRHIGKAGQGVFHVSYLIEGSKRILFAGDAAPTQWKDLHVDVLIAPYAYATTPASWRLSASIAEHLVLLHMPRKEQDEHGLWSAVEAVTQMPGPKLYIPQMGETLSL